MEKTGGNISTEYANSQPPPTVFLHSWAEHPFQKHRIKLLWPESLGIGPGVFIPTLKIREICQSDVCDSMRGRLKFNTDSRQVSEVALTESLLCGAEADADRTGAYYSLCSGWILGQGRPKIQTVRNGTLVVFSVHYTSSHI